MEFGIIGSSIWQQNMALMEHLTIDRKTREEKLKSLKASLGVDGLVYLATCNRVEFLYATSSLEPPNRLLHPLVDFFFSEGTSISFFPNDFYHHTGKAAVTHLFRTVASLESLVIGETQIAGQFKQAVEDATAWGLTGGALDELTSDALTLSRKIRGATGLCEGSLSMAALAAEELHSSLGSRQNPLIALIGAGEMTVKLARYISDSNPGRLLFVNRTVARAKELAEKFDGESVPLNEFISDPPDLDAILSATAAKGAVFDGDFLNRLTRGDKNIICVDLAVPRDFSADFVDHKRVVLIDIPALKSRGNGNLRKKFVAAEKANVLVREAVKKFLSSQIEVALKPIFNDSFQESLKLARNAFDDLFEKRVKSLRPEEKEAVFELVTKLIGHSSFRPAHEISDRLVRSEHELELNKFKLSPKRVV